MALSELLNWSLPPGVHACCTTRDGGVSSAPFASWNLGNHVGDDPEAVATNRQRLKERIGAARPVFLQQVHGVDALVLTPDTPDGQVADACVTTSPQVACTIMVADCLPLLFTDCHGRAVAAAHAGWRGLAGGVIENTLALLCQQARVPASEVQVWLGPCIGPAAFEVGPEVRDAFVAHDPDAQACFVPHGQRPGKWLAHLAGLATQRLQALGVTHCRGNNGSPAWCTVQAASDFFSYRRDGVTGRFAACIWREA